MVQPRICEVFGGTCDHRDTLLQIPFSIRWRIFHHLGLIRDTHIEGLDYYDFYTVDGHDLAPEERKDTKALLRTCKQLSVEVRAWLFRYNTVIYNTDGIYWWLQELYFTHPIAIYNMRDVYIVVQKQQQRYTKTRIDQPPLDAELIEFWQNAITNILSNAVPAKLRLHVVCQTHDPKKAKAILAPFHSFPNLVRELELCMSWENMHSLVEITPSASRTIAGLVRDAGRRAQWRKEVEPGKGFRFLDLPVELRQLVYSYTRLAMPYRKFTYERDYRVSNPSSEPGHRKFRPQFVFCEYNPSFCLDEDTHWNNRMMECGADGEAVGMRNPFCHWDRTTYSTRCNCGSSPLNLLVTCRAIYEEGLEFLYRYNRLVILPGGSLCRSMYPGAEIMEGPELPPWSRPVLLRHDALWSLLQKVGPVTAPCLRNMEIVFPRLDAISSLTNADPAYKEWVMSISMLSSLIAQDTGKNKHTRRFADLTLALHIWTTASRSGDGFTIGTALDPENFQKQAARLLAPLKNLVPHLRRLFVFLEWHEHWAPPKLRNDMAARKINKKKQNPNVWLKGKWIPGSKLELVEAEMKLEKSVMGTEYDACAVGKGNEMPSPWLRSVWEGCDE